MAAKAFQKSVFGGNRYAWKSLTDLIDKLAVKENVKPTQILMAPGSSDILEKVAMVLFQKGGNVISADPSYMSLIQVSKSVGGEWKSYKLKDDFQHDLEAMEAGIDENTKLVYICNPNNPTGSITDAKKIKDFCSRVSEKVPVFVDEAYIELSKNGLKDSMTSLVSEGKNVMVARTFSKIYGMAGLRIGYMIGKEETINQMKEITRGGMGITGPSIAAATKSLEESDFLNMCKTKIEDARSYTANYLKSKNYKIIPSETNFIIFEISMEGKEFLEKIYDKILLKKKFSQGDETNGIKTLILTLALPATIFIALLKVKIDTNLLALPVFAIVLNLVLFFVAPFLISFVGITKKTSSNSLRLLLPSLAPGLSCFPFILEFLGDNYLAKAAMADLGNKFFVLLILYLVAIQWHYKNNSSKKEPIQEKIKSLFKTLLLEPVNLFIFVALIFLSLGITIDKLPSFISETLSRLSLIMTPLVLIFIGLALKLNRKSFLQIFSLLMLRAAISLILVVTLVFIFKISVGKEILFLIAFSLSSCSFWPFAHISNIAFKEKEINDAKKTFDTSIALSVLALSLPISVIMILTMLTTGNTFTNINVILISAVILFGIGSIFPIINFTKQEFLSRKTKRLEIRN